MDVVFLVYVQIFKKHMHMFPKREGTMGCSLCTSPQSFIITFLILWLNNFGDCCWMLVLTLSVQIFPLIIIDKRGNFVYHHWGWRWIYLPLSLIPFDSWYVFQRNPCHSLLLYTPYPLKIKSIATRWGRWWDRSKITPPPLMSVCQFKTCWFILLFSLPEKALRSRIMNFCRFQNINLTWEKTSTNWTILNKP